MLVFNLQNEKNSNLQEDWEMQNLNLKTIQELIQGLRSYGTTWINVTAMPPVSIEASDDISNYFKAEPGYQAIFMSGLQVRKAQEC